MSSEIESLRCVTENTIAAEAARIERRGVDSASWCFSCGTLGPVGICQCRFPEALRCAGGRHLCERCRSAHAKISEFLVELFRTRPSSNPHSRREKLHLRLYRALENMGPEGKRARHYLAQSDSSDDEDRFRDAILRAFRRSSFFEFESLARGLERARDRELRQALIRSIRL